MSARHPSQEGLLRQRRGFLRIDAELLPDGVRHRDRGVFRSHESTIQFEDIDDSPTRFFYVNRLYLLICVFFAFLFAFRLYGFIFGKDVSVRALLLSAFWFALPVFGTWMHSAKYVGYGSRKGGIYFLDTRGKQDPSNFLQRMQQAKERHLRARYAFGNPQAPEATAPFRSRPPDGEDFGAN